MANIEAVLLEEKAPVTIRKAPFYSPSDDEVLVRNEVIAVQPFEAKLQKWAIFPLPYPANLGMAYAGTIEAVGPNVTDFAKGDRITINRGPRFFGDNRTGANQRFVIAPTDGLVKIGDTDSTEGAALITNLATAAPALSLLSGLDKPSKTPNPANKDKKVLIYGGSSQLGRLCVQYAHQAGYSVVTTSSPRNHDAVAELDPDTIVDHTLSADKIGAELVAHGPYAAVFDCVGNATTQAALTPVLLENKKQGFTNTAWWTGIIPDSPEGVEFKFASFPQVMTDQPENAQFKDWFFKEYMPAVLDGTFKFAPTPIERVSGGLGALQGILDRILEVSGKKIVINPWDE